MKKILFIIGLIYWRLLQVSAQESSAQIPRLVKNGNHVQLLVDNKPFLILGGELGNSSASGTGKPGRRMNGDQDHQGRHVRIPADEYSLQHIKLYTY
jgi:hypothetical protein